MISYIVLDVGGFMFRLVFILFAVSILLFMGCENDREEKVTVLNSANFVPDDLVKKNAQDTVAYVVIRDSSVADSVFREDTLSLSKGGFTKYFKWLGDKRGVHPQKIYYAYSDSTKPFVDQHGETSFLDAVALAYAHHYSLEISPDDIWLMLLDGIRIHVKENRETLKDLFVGPNTDTSIVILDNSLSLDSPQSQWDNVITMLSNQLLERMPKETAMPMSTRFSTTSHIDFNVSKTMVMAVASQYYSYEVHTLCGIPGIKLRGSKEDWNLLKTQYNLLAERLDLYWWSRLVNPILDKLISAADGETDVEFWRGIYKYKEAEFCGEQPTFNGWISKFFPYSEQNNKYTRREDFDVNMSMDRVPKGITSFDIKWKYFDEDIRLRVYTGFVGTQIDAKENTVKAGRGYAVTNLDDWLSAKNAKDERSFTFGEKSLHESIFMAESLNVYNSRGLAFATNDRKIIEEFGRAISIRKSSKIYSQSHGEIFRDEFEDLSPMLGINLYYDNELIDHVDYFDEQPLWRLLIGFVRGVFSESYVGEIYSEGLRTLQWNIFLNDSKDLKSFFKKYGVSIDGYSAEFAYEKNLPELNLNYEVTSPVLKKWEFDGKYFELKNWDKFSEEVSDHAILNYNAKLAFYVRKDCEWKLKRAYYRYYKNGESVNLDAEIPFNMYGTASGVIMKDNTLNKDFVREVQEILDQMRVPTDGTIFLGYDKDNIEIKKTVHIEFFKAKLRFEPEKK